MSFYKGTGMRSCRKWLLIGCLLVSLCSFFFPDDDEPETLRVMFWNIENLFDIKDDRAKQDDDFLPDADRHWTYSRYRDKLKNIAKTIVASGNERVPDLVGLCEVENDSCLYDLIKRSPLREAGYRYVMTNSPDERGIDVALLYQRGSFKLLDKQSIRIPNRLVKRGPTRDILHVVGKVVSGDTLDVLVCHLPSRSEGKAKSEPFRLLVAKMLRQTADSLMNVRKNPYLVIMGDFNDYPSDKSLRKVLCGKGDLINLMKGLDGGTYRYRGEWGIFDQFVVSASMYRNLEKVQIVRHPFLLEEDDRYGGDKPFRTYNGLRYHGGFSDHLPIVSDFLIRGGTDCCSE